MDMEMLKELLKKKKDGEDMDPMEKDASMSVLKQIHKLASDSMGGDVKGLKSVTVSAPDEEGVTKGLQAAEEMVHMHNDGKTPEDKIAPEKVMEEADETNMDDDEIAELEALISQMKSKKMKP